MHLLYDNIGFVMTCSRLADLILIFFLLLCGAGIAYSETHFADVETKVGRFTPPPAESIYLTFGYPELFADSLWIRVVQDFGYCENRDSQKKVSSYEYARVVKRDEHLHCEKGWVYQMIDRVTDLDPKFRVAYDAGGTMLSLLGDDKKGAQLIFSKGLQHFPNDWNILYRAGYHQLFEMKNNERAAAYMNRAAKGGGPAWLSQLAARLYTKEGKAELGRSVLDEFAKSNPELTNSERFKQLSAQIDDDLKSARTPAEASRQIKK